MSNYINMFSWYADSGTASKNNIADQLKANEKRTAKMLNVDNENSMLGLHVLFHVQCSALIYRWKGNNVCCLFISDQLQALQSKQFIHVVGKKREKSIRNLEWDSRFKSHLLFMVSNWIRNDEIVKWLWRSTMVSRKKHTNRKISFDHWIFRLNVCTNCSTIFFWKWSVFQTSNQKSLAFFCCVCLKPVWCIHNVITPHSTYCRHRANLLHIR